LTIELSPAETPVLTRSKISTAVDPRWSVGGKMSSDTYRRALEALHAVLEARLPHAKARIYEAGGGSTSFVNLSFVEQPNITVVDIDEAQLRHNRYADRKILGDIETETFPPNSFDLIVCYNVLEHLLAPDRAVGLFYGALAPDGLLVIGAPHPQSFSGMITKLTPHWFHIWYYRFVLGHKSAGQPGSVPFRTVYHPIVTPSRLIAFGQQLGFRVVHFHEYEGDQYERIALRNPFVGKVVNLTVSMANALFFGRRDLRKGEFHLVLQKPRSVQA
jgi:SAM-dependent methyltransferase